MIQFAKRVLPWQCKIVGKILLSRLPLSYRFWGSVGLFKHGPMADAGYAVDAFSAHYRRFREVVTGGAFTCLELGPGDSLLSALVACSHGAAHTYLVDVGAFARTDVHLYRKAARTISLAAGGVEDPERWRCVTDVLGDCRAIYLTEGLTSLRSIPDASVDFIWSQAVLEHVRKYDFEATMAELRRVIRIPGVASHWIDLKDHLGGKLNNLRFNENLWEGPFFAKSGFYTNRLRHSEILRVCRQVGFSIRESRCDYWPELPTPVGKMNATFQAFDTDDLRVSGCNLVLVPA